jgi:hypothetical protein
MAEHRDTPRAFDAYPDSDSRPPHEIPDGNPSIFDEKAIARHVYAILRQRNPHRDRQVARSATEFGVLQRPCLACRPAIEDPLSTPSHDVDAIQRVERTNQHRRGPTGSFGDHVYERVDAVVEIDVGVTRRTVQRLVSRGGSRGSMAGWIGFTDVRLDLYNHATGR